MNDIDAKSLCVKVVHMYTHPRLLGLSKSGILISVTVLQSDEKRSQKSEIAYIYGIANLFITSIDALWVKFIPF